MIKYVFLSFNESGNQVIYHISAHSKYDAFCTLICKVNSPRFEMSPSSRWYVSIGDSVAYFVGTWNDLSHWISE